MTTHTEYITDNVGLLDSGIEAIAMMGSELYARPVGLSGGSPVGAHFRHVFDHYQAFIDGLPALRVDYDARERDTRIEQDAARAGHTARKLAGSITDIATGDLDSPIQVSANLLVEGESTIDWTASTVQRELMYLLSHTVHHYAIIRLLAAQLGVTLDDEFGVAPSTLAYRRHHAACAPSAG
jgi:hypothetical protein